MVRRLSLVLFTLPLFAPAPAPAAALSGVARVVDGDTIAFGSTRVRIWGIDAPETRQPCTDARGRSWACGIRGAQALTGWLAGRLLACRQRDRDDNGRPVATYTVAGQDIAA